MVIWYAYDAVRQNGWEPSTQTEKMKEDNFAACNFVLNGLGNHTARIVMNV